MSSKVLINTRKAGEVTILQAEGRIAFGQGDQELGEAVRGALADGARKLLLDFSKVDYMDSSGIGELVGCFAAIKNKQGHLRLCGLNAKVFGLMKMTSLHSVFETFDSEAEALKGF
jgi:anti-anti-sigma factor